MHASFIFYFFKCLFWETETADLENRNRRSVSSDCGGGDARLLAGASGYTQAGHKDEGLARGGSSLSSVWETKHLLPRDQVFRDSREIIFGQ